MRDMDGEQVLVAAGAMSRRDCRCQVIRTCEEGAPRLGGNLKLERTLTMAAPSTLIHDLQQREGTPAQTGRK